MTEQRGDQIKCYFWVCQRMCFWTSSVQFSCSLVPTLFFFLAKLIFIFYWNIVDIQHCIMCTMWSFCAHTYSKMTLWDPMNGRPPCPSPTPGVHPNPCQLSRWCDPIIWSSVVPFTSCPQSFPASGSSQMSQLFASGGQSVGVSTSASFLPVNIQDWLPLEWTGWISLQSKGLSRVFSNTTVPKQQFFSTQLFL